MKDINISVITPIYNEEGNIIRLINKLEHVLSSSFSTYEIIAINDGSTDNSKQILEELPNKNLKIINFEKNLGQTAAISAGFKAAEGLVVATIDSDMQVDPEDIIHLYSFIDRYDLINGKRMGRKDGIIKKISSLVGNGVRNMITGDDIKDTGCPLKLYKREVIKSYHLYDGMHRFLPTLAKINGYKVIEVSVEHHERIYDKSKYGVFDRLFKGLKDAFVVRWIKNNTIHAENYGDGAKNGIN